MPTDCQKAIFPSNLGPIGVFHRQPFGFSSKDRIFHSNLKRGQGRWSRDAESLDRIKISTGVSLASDHGAVGGPRIVDDGYRGVGDFQFRRGFHSKHGHLPYSVVIAASKATPRRAKSCEPTSNQTDGRSVPFEDSTFHWIFGRNPGADRIVKPLRVSLIEPQLNCDVAIQISSMFAWRSASAMASSIERKMEPESALMLLGSVETCRMRLSDAPCLGRSCLASLAEGGVR